METWRTIDGYDNYEISSYGNVRNSTTGKLLKTRINNSTGYVMVDIRNCEKRKTCSVHRLVAQAFISNENDLPQVNHKDENKQNNHIDNLEWCTAKYNCNYGTHNEKMKEAKRLNPRVYTDEERQIMSERMSGENHWNYGNTWSEETKYKNMMSQQNRKRVRCIETGEEFESIRAAARAYNVNKSRISDAITHRNRVQTCAGYHWAVV